MTTRYEASMDGTSLSGLDASIVILDIAHRKPEIEVNAASVANRPGAKIMTRVVRSAGVTISFMIRKYSLSDRQSVCDMVVAWAGGSVLRTNDRAGKHLQVICEQYPEINSAKNWTDPVTMTFTAVERPFWEDDTQTTLTVTGTVAQESMNVPGSAGEALVEVTVTANAAVTGVALVAGSTEIELEDIALDQGDTVTIDYKDGIQRIRKGNTSVLGNRTKDSSDDLLAACGKMVTFAVESDASVTAVFKVRGCWL